MTDYSKRILVWFAVILLCLGSVMALQYFTGLPLRLLQTTSKSQPPATN
jgi:hypothetical protein